MLPAFYIPLMVAAGRVTIACQLRKCINSAVPKSIDDARQRLSGFFAGALAEMTLTIALLVAAACWADRFFERHATVALVCSIYAGSMLHNGLKLMRYSPMVFALATRHRMSLKAYLYDQIYGMSLDHTRQQMARMGAVKRLAYRFCMGPVPEKIARQIADTATPLIWRAVWIRLLLLGLAVGIYSAVFRLYLAPLLLQQSTSLNPFQAFLWPFAFSLDFFLHTHLQQAVASLEL